MKCSEHGDKDNTASIIHEFRSRVSFLINNGIHRNVVRYTGIKIDTMKDSVKIYLLQEYVKGVSLKQMIGQNQLPHVATMAKDILQAIDFIHQLSHSIQVTHGYLRPESIFLDDSGKYRSADFNVVPYMMYLNGNHKLHEKSDIDTLGTLIISMNEIVSKVAIDFAELCSSKHISSYSKLMEHPLIQFNNSTVIENKNNQTSDTAPEERFLEHFDIVEHLGTGSFGVVLKVKNHIDKRLYAVKIIKIPSDSKKEVEQLEREAEISSSINHNHVVRCTTSWKQKMDMTKLMEYTDDDVSSMSSSST